MQSNSYSVLLGQTATLVCTITANPSATSVQWYRVINGVQSSLSTTAGKYNTPTVTSPNLNVNNAQQSDAGYYVCTATNIVGTGTSAQTYLAVTGSKFVFLAQILLMCIDWIIFYSLTFGDLL